MTSFKNKKPDLITIFWTSDLHFRGDKQPDREKLENFRVRCEYEKPDLVIDTGDWIDGVSYEQDIEDLHRFVDEWDKIHCRKVMIPGNHDFTSLDYEDIYKVLEYSSSEEIAQSRFNKTLVLSNEGVTVRIVLIDAYTSGNGKRLTGSVKSWVKEVCSKATEDMMLIFTHEGTIPELLTPIRAFSDKGPIYHFMGHYGRTDNTILEWYYDHANFISYSGGFGDQAYSILSINSGGLLEFEVVRTSVYSHLP